ncbi:HAD-like protein [Ophiobolus disseminans]|uniref:HAD-like protein n=1 Tax=Ophiobolus disseminans TaxID=1469910 RepID=A0A6A6ZV62_9PLEO|nr:HAD-like protein [Ophiobolus disseminans]
MDQTAFCERLSEVSWFFFDLDDTLHSFRAASSTATTSTLQLILVRNPNYTFSVSSLQSSYAAILESRTQAAFVDGKTSHQYRQDRFRLLLEEYRVEVVDETMEALLACYETTLIVNVQLKPGAQALLQTLKARGKKIAIITEGPQDAQERTIAALGLAPFVDYLATTNEHGVAKTNGLFPRVLEALGVNGKEVVMVGDSWERDIVPATHAGISCHWTNYDI